MDERERTEERRATEAMTVRMREYQASCGYASEALLAAYPCAKCGSREPQDGRGFFTARTYHRTNSLGAFVVLYSRAAVERLIARTGMTVLCEACWLRMQANGSWAAILAARAESWKEKENAG